MFNIQIIYDKICVNFIEDSRFTTLVYYSLCFWSEQGRVVVFFDHRPLRCNARIHIFHGELVFARHRHFKDFRVDLRQKMHGIAIEIEIRGNLRIVKEAEDAHVFVGRERLEYDPFRFQHAIQLAAPDHAVPIEHIHRREYDGELRFRMRFHDFHDVLKEESIFLYIITLFYNIKFDL